jgi:hypothetical protein
VLAVLVGMLAVLVVLVMAPGARSKIKPVRTTARNHLSQFFASSHLLTTNQNAAVGSSKATPGFDGEKVMSPGSNFR